ncbi:MAG TPA: M23 family metallopeptidase [Stellaceae bacterium]|nr:M23 family metallopeptidase [Stellaceae bacterium]
MEKPGMRRHGLACAAAAVALASLVAGCSSDPTNPAPVILKGADAGISPDGPLAYRMPPLARPLPRTMSGPGPMPGPALRGDGRRIVVRPGQSLGGIAQAYRVSEHAIVAANHLQPPYKIEIGQTLLIPGGGEHPLALASEPTPPLSPPPAPPPSLHPAAERTPDIIPLDGPAPPPHPAERAQAAPRSAPEAAPQPAPEASAAPAPHGGHFAWPVRGRVLEGYGVAAGGAHNDGINIAAPRGAPVKAIDGGTVAYAGNELRGYGNLVLIKHEGGWISAYAHCEDLLVKRGETVSRGQVIAKVGETGGVKEPQLHFELRRGKKAVDPREFLAPAPSADSDKTPRAG